MARNAIPTYTTGQVVSAAHANTYWRDNEAEHWAQIQALKPTFQSYTPTITYGGGTTDPTGITVNARYCVMNQVKILILYATLNRGSGDRTVTYISLPTTLAFGGFSASCSCSYTGTWQVVPAFPDSGLLRINHGTMSANGTLEVTLIYY